MPLSDSLPGFVNAHTHSPLAAYRGVTRSRPFEQWFTDRSIRYTAPPTPEEVGAFALVNGLENLAAGNTAFIDHYNGPATAEHVYAVAGAYESLGVRAWVLVDQADLPRAIYTREAYPRFAGAIATADLPPELQALLGPARPYQEQLDNVRSIIRGWKGSGRVKLGVGLSNAVWCSDGLLAGGAALAHELDVPIAIHAEESPVQRQVCLAQWGMSGIRRLAEFGVLGPKTIVAHVVQVDDEDIEVLAASGASVAHNPISNMKLQNGIAPAGRLLAAGVNVCLGTDGTSCADDQNLYPVLRFAAALARLNGIGALPGGIEETVLAMATAHGYRFWFNGDPAADRVRLSEPVAAFAPVWADLSRLIQEVIVDGRPILSAAKAHVAATSAPAIVRHILEQAASPEKDALAGSLISIPARYAIPR